jgi:hypothetical protein
VDRRLDLSVINFVLKVLCRENRIERDRRAVLQVATLLLSLWKQGMHETGELERVAREKLAEVTAAPNVDPE